MSDAISIPLAALSFTTWFNLFIVTESRVPLWRSVSASLALYVSIVFTLHILNPS